jgi:general secretion pathway protein E
MGIERYLVEDSVIGVAAQRLVRKKSAHGYEGRSGIYEVLLGTTPQNGMRTLVDNGLAKVEAGITTEEEVRRVIYLE